MRLLQADNDVETRYGGRFVQSIDGLDRQGAGGSADWFFFVNGFEADVGAAEYELSPGDVVQWDYRNWRGHAEVRAIVGAFPEPFLNGIEGKRRPVRVECADSDRGSAGDVKRCCARAACPPRGSSLGATGTQNVIRVVVAAWDRARDAAVGARARAGTRSAAACSRASDDGGRLDLLDERGRTVRSRGTRRRPGGRRAPARRRAGLGGHRRQRGGRRDAAAPRSTRRSLRDAFAVARTPGGPRSCRWRRTRDGGLVPVYRPRPSPLHAARAGAGAAFCARVRAGVRALRAPAGARRVAGRRCWAPGIAAGVGAELRARRLAVGAAGAADRAGQPARLPGGRHAARPRRHLPRPALRHHARGARRGRRSRGCG